MTASSNENKAYRMSNNETRVHTIVLTSKDGSEITVKSSAVVLTEISKIGGNTIVHLAGLVNYAVMETQQQIWEMIQADGPVASSSTDTIKDRDTYHPKIGERTLCESCAGEIEYVGPYWRHIGTNPRHNAMPPKTYYLLPQKKA